MAPPRQDSADFYLNARFSFTDLKNQKYFTGRIIWIENDQQFSIQILGPLDIPFAQIKKENENFCFIQKNKKSCGIEADKKLKDFNFLLSRNFKNTFKGIENNFLKENNIQTNFIYEEGRLSKVQFKNEKQWNLKLAIEEMEF